MKKVFMPSNSRIPVWQQFPSDQTIWGDYEFILGSECDEYDFLVVIDSLQKPIVTKCPKENSVLFTGEPPTVKKYSSDFLNQFGFIYSCQQELVKKRGAKLSYPALPWMLTFDFFGVTGDKYLYYNYFDTSKTKIDHERLNKYCILISNKRITKEHCNRIRFAERLKHICPDLFDIYGLGYGKMDVKYDVLSKYKYCLVIENTFYPNYWTEKLADAFLAGCYPAYYGAPNIADFFSEDSYTSINISDFEGSLDKLRKVISLDLYETKKTAMEDSRRRVLYDYNMFALITNSLNSIGVVEPLSEPRIVEPMVFPKIELLKRKVRRFWYEHIYQLSALQFMKKGLITGVR